MAEIRACPKCQRKLQVPEQFFGQTVQCPECRHMFEAAAPALSPRPAAAPAAPSLAPSRRYDDEPRNEAPRPRRPDDDDFDDFDRPQRIRRNFEPHRGDMIMALGIISLVGALFCVPIFLGPIAWAMGSYELQGIRDGRVDPSGESQTRTGLICGMVSTILLLLMALVFCLLIYADHHGF